MKKRREPLEEQLTYQDLLPFANNLRVLRKVMSALSYHDLVKLLVLTESGEVVRMIEEQKKLSPLLINFYKEKKNGTKKQD